MHVIVDEEQRLKFNSLNMSSVDLKENKKYEVVGISKKLGWYQIIDESGEDYLYPPSLFKIVE